MLYWLMNKQTLLRWRHKRLNNCVAACTSRLNNYHADDELKMLSELAQGLRILPQQRQRPNLRKDYTSSQSEHVQSQPTTAAEGTTQCQQAHEPAQATVASTG